MYYEQIIRAQIAAERIERIADACERSDRRRARRRVWRRAAVAVGFDPAYAVVGP
jgi:hypothetical protein